MKGLATLVLLGAVMAGGWYYYHHKAATDAALESTDTAVVSTTSSGIDAVLMAELKSVAPVSLAYYAEHRNYGTSSGETICDDTTSGTSIGAIVADVETYTKSISCAVAPSFPSATFTITAPSFEKKGEYYCTDQNGKVGLIPGLSPGSGFRAGISCGLSS